MLESTNRYAATSREYLRRAWGYLDANDLSQASEKGWGAAVEMVKAVAEERGWPHDSHRLLFRVVRDLTNETGHDQLPRMFALAYNLHINHYENWLSAEDVQLYLQEVQTLLGKLEEEPV